MHLVILTQYYPPEIGAPQARLSELAQRITKAGHKVTVLTAMPNYPYGKIQSGYAGLFMREQLNEVEVIRAFIYPTQSTSFLRRMSNYLSFVFSSMLIGSFTLQHADFLLVESPPLFLGLAAIWLKWIKQARLIFNVSDLWPESAVILGVVRKNSISHKLSLWLENLCYHQAWLITGQSKSILNDIRNRFPSMYVYHLSNGADVQKFSPKYREAHARGVLGQADKCIVLYAGLHGIAQGLNQILDAATRLKGEKTLRFVLIGDGPEKAQLIRTAQEQNLDNVSFLDSRPSSEIPPLIAASDIVLITLKLYIPGAVPSKLYEAMASGRPVIMVAEGEPADIVTKHEAGVAVKPGDIDGIVEAVRALEASPELRNRYGQNGRRAAEQWFNRDKIATEFIQMLENAN